MHQFEKPKDVPIFEREPMGYGFESIVYLSPQSGYVVKAPNINQFLNGHDRGLAMGRWLASQEHGKELEKEDQRASAILGDRLIPSWFFFEQEVQGIEGKTYLRVQPMVAGRREEGNFVLWSTLPAEDKQTIVKIGSNQHEVTELIWALKSYHYHMGFPFDMKEDNIVYETNEKKFYFLEAGFPTEMKKIIEDPTYLPEVFSRELRLLLVQMMRKRLTGPFALMGDVVVNQKLKDTLDKKYKLPADFNYPNVVMEMESRYEQQESVYLQGL